MRGAAALNPEVWVDQHGDVLFRYAMARVGVRDVAEDLVQEAFLSAWQARADFAGASSERTWLVGILKHRIGDHFRRAFRERAAQSESHADDPAVEAFFSRWGKWRKHPPKWADPPGAFSEAEFWGTLEQCVGKLPSQQAAAYALREIDGLSSEDICKILEVTPTNLWTLLHRARLRLRECLSRNWFGSRA